MKMVFIGIPLYVGLENQAVAPLLNCLVHTQKILYPMDIEIHATIRVIVWKAREQLRQQFFRSKADYLFFVSEDIVLEQDTLIKLLSYDLPIVSGTYYDRKRPHFPYTFFKNSDGGYCYRSVLSGADLAEVDATGLDCCLLKREVLEKVSDKCFEPKTNMPGEDLVFFEEARKAGYKIIVARRVEVGHISETKRIIHRKDNIKAICQAKENSTWVVEERKKRGT